MKRIFFVVSVIICLLIINGLLHSIYSLWNKQDLIIKAQKDLETKKKENTSLKQQLSQALSPQFIEEQARNKLFMVKPNEQEIIVPQTTVQQSGETVVQPDPNWEQWVRLFFH